jgi:hypothetical protein
MNLINRGEYKNILNSFFQDACQSCKKTWREAGFQNFGLIPLDPETQEQENIYSFTQDSYTPAPSSLKKNEKFLFSTFLRSVDPVFYHNKFFIICRETRKCFCYSQEKGLKEVESRDFVQHTVKYTAAEIDRVINYQIINNCEANLLFYIPVVVFYSKTIKFIQPRLLYTIFGTMSATDAEVVTPLLPGVERIFSPLSQFLFEHITYCSNYRLQMSQVKSAIGSIMSRNGSHNIGSHVLAALSHNVGTMPDDRVLYQYIQHRMDYIATATTDFPTWCQPTMFLGTLMKTFLSQRHLLDNIAGSEELGAWKFQGRNAHKTGDSSSIQIHIRAIKDGRRKKLLEYDNDGGTVHLEDDVSLAIPGGAVGQHAFFTIIENVIRNAAKHDWSSPPEKTRGNKFGEDGAIVGNLEVYIDFEDLPEEGNVAFTIFTNMSDADDNVLGSGGTTSLLKLIEQSLDAQFVDENGGLRKENWGLAEMKLSAGYLQMREPGVIGGMEDTSEKAKAANKTFGTIIKPLPVRIDETDKVNHLGYYFKVAKTRTLLVITDEEDKNLVKELNEAKGKILARHGIYVKTASAAESADNSFEFVLMDAFTKDRLQWRLPFRIVCTNPEKCDKRTLPLVAHWNAQGETTATIVDKLVKCSNDEVAKEVEALLDQVAACWTQYFKTVRRGIHGPLNLVVSTESKDDKSGQSLVNPASAVRFVFEEGFKRAVDSFWNLISVSMEDYREDWLQETDAALSHLEEKAKHNDVDESIRQSDEIFSSLVIKQLNLWLADCKELSAEGITKYLSGKNAGGETGIDADEDFKSHPFKQFVDYLTEVCVQAKGYLGQYAERIPTIPRKFDSFARDGDKQGGGASEVWKNTCVELSSEALSKNSDKADNASDESFYTTIQYYRHYEPVVCRENNNETPDFITTPFKNTNNLYIEPLSGTQSYFSQMRMLMEDKQTNGTAAQRLFQSKLVECALMRMLIIDERVSRFVNNHSDLTLATFALMNISVADDKLVTNELESRRNGTRYTGTDLAEKIEFTPRGLVKLDAVGIEKLRTAIRENDTVALDELAKRYQPFNASFDVLIVHQGILDKWFQDLVSDDRTMSDLYDAFKKVFPYVIITTGRGTPANIPDMARVLPFSTIETTLFRKYPEKLVLVDAIMNILPIRKKQSTSVP